MTEIIKQEDPELNLLRINREDGYTFRRRRHDNWTENYTLYRDTVKVNRLTQRQSVNIPLMKQSVKTLLKDIDDMPLLYFENLDNDKQKEIYLNESWKNTQKINNMSVQDIVDKKQTIMTGRGFTQFQVVDGKVRMFIVDSMDMFVSRYVDPTNLHSSRYLVHGHIFVPLSQLRANIFYNQDAVTRLQNWFVSKEGIVKLSENMQSYIDKQQRLSDMGLSDAFDPVLGEAYVELEMQFVFREKESRKGKMFENQIFLYVSAENREILMKKPLEEVIGETRDNYWKTHYPYNTWAEDVEHTDFWSDGPADVIRTPNKILNSWFSQLVENRTLRNYGMNFYNSLVEGFEPQTFNAVPFGWYPFPGDPNKDIRRVDIPNLQETMPEMEFLIALAEKATGATATQQGATEQRQITLGEVELALTEAKARVKGMSKLYTPAWEQRGELYVKMIEAAGDKIDDFKAYKKGRLTDKIFSRNISTSEVQSKSGYGVKVWSQDEKDVHDIEVLNKLSATKQMMPDNPKLDEILKRKAVEFIGLTPEEINDIMEFEKQKREALMLGGGQGVPGAVQPQAQLPAPRQQTQTQAPQALLIK